MVRRLVQEEDRGVRKEEPGDLGAVLLPPRELSHRPVPRGSRQADAGQDALHARVGLPAASALEPLPHLVVLGEEDRERGLVPDGAVRRDRLLEPGHFGREARETLLRPRHERPERLVPLRLDGLLERGKRGARGDQPPPAVGLQRPGDDRKDGRLPRPVPPHETHDPFRVVLPRGVGQDLLAAEALADVLQTVEHRLRIAEGAFAVQPAVPSAGPGLTPDSVHAELQQPTFARVAAPYSSSRSGADPV